MNKIIDYIKRNDVIFLLFFVLIAFFLFSPSLENLNFFWDDERFIFANPSFIQAPSWLSFWDITSPFYKVWSLGYSVFWWIIHIFPQDNFLIGKLLNIVFHSLNAFLVYRVFNKIKIPYAVIGGLIFLVHPLHTESISWFFQLMTILSFTFFCSSLLFFFDYQEKNKNSSLILSCVFFLFSILTKSIALTVPFIFIFYFLFNKKKNFNFKKMIPIFLITSVIGVLNILGTQEVSFRNSDDTATAYLSNKLNETLNKDVSLIKEDEYFNFIFTDSVLNNSADINFSHSKIFSQSLFHYTKKIIFPYKLQYIYPVLNYSLAIPFILIIFYLAWAYYLLHFYSREKITFIFCYITSLITPYLGFTFIAFFYWSPVSDRYTYFLIPGFIGLILLTINILKDSKVKNILFAFYLVFLSITTFSYAQKFNNPKILYTEILEYKKHPVLYSLLFEIYLNEVDVNNAEKVLLEGLKFFPNDNSLKNDMLRLNSLIKSYYGAP